MMTELTPDRIMEAEQSLRLDVINSTVNIDMRLARLYDLLENDLLGALTLGSHYIAPYKVRCKISPAACLCGSGMQSRAASPLVAVPRGWYSPACLMVSLCALGSVHDCSPSHG